jgi:protein ImuB
VGPERTLALWCPAWAVATARQEDASIADTPVAIVERGPRGMVVFAASAQARAAGVTTGLRRREAEARCAELVVVERDPAAEARAFESVARATESITPAVVLERPGVLTFPTRGPSRYFGGDDALAARVLETISALGVSDVRVGIADGAFAARLATRRAEPGASKPGASKPGASKPGASKPGASKVVAPGESPTFLAPWPVGVLRGLLEGGAADALTSLLVRLGLRTLGDFAALPAPSVLARFGTDGARAHRTAAGLDELTAAPTPPPPELVETCELDPPATRIDEVAFVAKELADRLLDRLATLGLSCSQVVVEAETEHGERHSRCWRHEGGLTAAALTTRVRWQLDAWLTNQASAADPVTAGLTLLRLAPDRVVPATGRQLGLWGGDAAAVDRAERVLARLQGMLGHDAVVTAVLDGGRAPTERVRWVPWGEPRDEPVVPDRAGDAAPWPGAVPGPAPARVYVVPVPAELLDASGDPVRVSGRGEAPSAPAHLRSDALPGGSGAVVAWAGPWAHDLRWWDRITRRRRVLWQVVVTCEREHQLACLVVMDGGRAAVEAVYD